MDRDCRTCVHSNFHGEDNGCDSWECEYINKKEAIEAWNKRTPIIKDDMLKSLDQTAEYLKTMPIDELRDKIIKVNAEIEKWGKPLKTPKK